MYSALEHKIIASNKAYPVAGKWVCAVSGGVDSVVGLELLNRLRKPLGVEMVVCCIHHGPSEDKSLQEYRIRSQQLVQQLCLKLQLKFVAIKSDNSLKNEAEMRSFRYQALQQLVQQSQARGVITFHHQDDLLETQLHRLIRGVGVEGLKAIRPYRKDLWRPLLSVKKAELKDYAEAHEIDFAQDPSNLDTKYFRNWLRLNWLEKLESDHSGYSNSLARSLRNVANKSQMKLDHFMTDGKLDRLKYFVLSENEKRQLLVKYLRHLDAKQMRATQYLEILKQLDKNVSEHTFQVGGLVWHNNAQQIWCVLGKK